jgi:hypothetical protein
LRSGFRNEGGKYVECYSKSANNGVAGANEAISTFGFNISSSNEASPGRTGARPSKIITASIASSNVASTGVVGAKSDIVRIETVDSEISSNVANAGVDGAKMRVFNEAASLFIYLESEWDDANIMFTEKRNIPVKIRVLMVVIAFILFLFEVDEAKIYRIARVVDVFSIEQYNLPAESGKQSVKM